jgi:hypothetical protein
MLQLHTARNQAAKQAFQSIFIKAGTRNELIRISGAAARQPAQPNQPIPSFIMSTSL